MIQGTVNGIPDLRKVLSEIAPKLRKRALRNALAAGARLVRDAAKRATPVLAAPIRRNGQVIRKPGTVRDAISVRTSKRDTRAGDVGVFVNVKPAQGAKFKTATQSKAFGLIKVKTRTQVRASKRGTNSPDDPYYWRWLEFGSRGNPGAKFLQSAVAQLDAAREKFAAVIGPALERLGRKQEP